MTSPVTVSLEVPYAESEQQFLVLAVQTAVRTFRSMKLHCDDPALAPSAPSLSSSSTSSPQ
jgi:hypothetical protein